MPITHAMSAARIGERLQRLLAQGGRVDLGKLDELMLEARDGGGLDAAERAQLQQALSRFDDAGKQRLLKHLAVMDQRAAFVNVDTRSPLRAVEGRYGALATDVRGLTVRVGLFDNTFAVSGRAQKDGVLRLTIEGKSITVPVRRGATGAQVLDDIRRSLPSHVTGLVLSGDASLHEVESFQGQRASRSEQSAHLVLYKPQALGLRPLERPLRVVVTGFGRFADIEDNPSAEMAQRLAKAGVKGAIVEYRRLDVTTAAADAFIEEMKRNPPDVILSMGHRRVAQLEERPENIIGTDVDGEGQPIVGREVRPGRPAELRTDLPVAVIDGVLRRFGPNAALRTSLSNADYSPDRTKYLCNYLGYLLADSFGPTDDTTAGFMHINEETLTEQVQAVLDAVVARQLEYRREKSRPAA